MDVFDVFWIKSDGYVKNQYLEGWKCGHDDVPAGADMTIFT
jgi:hypothetical protein